MSSTDVARVFTCDLCGKTPLTADEVAEVRISFAYPDRWREDSATIKSSARFDACKTCLDTRRAPNSRMEFNESVYLHSNDAQDSLGLKVLRWFFPEEPSDD